MIAFTLTARAHTRLDVCDAAGRSIAMLLDEARGPGDYSVEWNGRDNAGQPVSNGVYYVRLRTDLEERTGVMIRI